MFDLDFNVGKKIIEIKNLDTETCVSIADGSGCFCEVSLVPQSYSNYRKLYRKVIYSLSMPLPDKVKYQKWYQIKLALYNRKKFAAAYRDFIKQIDSDKVAFDKRLYSFRGPNYTPTQTAFSYHSLCKYEKSDIMKYNAAGLVAATERYGYPIKPWRHHYGHENNKSLNKTLMSLPRRIPTTLPREIRHAQPLICPIYGRAKIIGYFLSGRTFISKSELIQKTTEQQIYEARDWLAKKTPELDLNFRSFHNIVFFVNYVMDYPEVAGTFLSQTKKSFKWHQENNRNHWSNNQYKPDTKLPVFNTNLDIKEIKQLLTVAELNEESKKMSHCIASYVQRCIDSKSYIFHVNYKKSHATMEVNKEGNMVQVRGPRNQTNEACKYATKLWNNKARN